MKTFDLDLKSVIIGFLLTILIVTFMLIATTERSPRAWEYKNFTSTGMSPEPALNKLGSEGWELVGFTYAKSPTAQSPDYSYYVFKRAKQKNWNWKFWK